MKKVILFAVSFLSATIAIWAQQAGTQTVNSGTVPIEEYVPKVIIEGKWGSNPGEFGVAGVTLDDFNPISPTMTPVYPSSLAINKMGQIYILDIVNNRIQKFSEDGKFIKEIPVESWTGYVLNPKVEGLWESKITGINIVIDSKDTLYYYLKRIKDGKETGEVWGLRNDKLVNKKMASLDRNIQAGIPKEKYVDPKVDAEIKELPPARNLNATDKKKRQLSFRLDDGEELYGQRRVVYDEGTNKWAVRIKKGGKIWDKFYGPSGKPLSVRQVPELSEFIDSKGSYYFIETSNTGLTVRKNELTRVKK